MRREMKPFRTGLLLAALVAFPALAQTGGQEDEDNTRSVRIIEAPVAAPAVSEPTASPPSPEELQQLSAPAVPQVVVPPPAQLPLAPAPSAAAPRLPDATSPSYNVMSAPQSAVLSRPPKQFDLGALESSIRVANPAEISIEMLPGQEFAAGARVSFRVSTKKAGYLILLDVDAAGKLTQIYPNPSSLTLTPTNQQNANYVRPGKPIQIPSPTEAGSFEFVASPPFGTAMVVALLSDKPVQLVNLPDLPISMSGQAAALTFLTKLAGDLRISQGNDAVRLEEPHWSFDAKFYAIR
jgi:hypothetical protein